MRHMRCSILSIAMSLFLLLIFLWKTQNLFSHETDVYSLIRDRKNEISNIISSCIHLSSAHQDHDKFENKRTKDCTAGMVLDDGECVFCPGGMFSLPGWIACENNLGCEQIVYEVRVTKSLYTVGNWRFNTAEWRGSQILHAAISSQEGDLISNFKPEIIKQLSPHANILYPIGFCRENGIILFIESMKIRGPATELNSMLSDSGQCEHWIVRFRLAIDYVKILAHLHTTANGPIVLCNSNSLPQTLSQFVVTDRWNLILATFDNLQQRRNGQNVMCSEKELTGGIIAPEQRWPYGNTKVFNIHQQRGYTEAADVWKIPDITEALLGNSKIIMDHLSLIHYHCKNSEPRSRPTAVEVWKEYEHVWKILL